MAEARGGRRSPTTRADPPRGLRPAPDLLSPEDRALWRRVTATLAPLRGRRGGTRLTETAPQAPTTAAPQDASATARAPRRDRPRVDPATPPPPRTELSRRELRRLKAGGRVLDAVIDLHGLDRIAAHDLLLARLKALQAAGARTVLVVTGKGRRPGPEGETGVLARLLPLWLAEPPFRALVHAAQRAAPRHGGQGAVYLLLRRHARAAGS